MNSKETTLSFDRIVKIWRESEDMVNTPGYQPTQYGENKLDAYISGTNTGYDVITYGLSGLEISIVEDIYRRAGELNEARKKGLLKDEDNKIINYGDHFLDQYIVLNDNKTNYEKKSSFKNLDIAQQKDVEHRIDDLNKSKIDIDDLLKYIGTDENKKTTNDNKKKKNKKRKNKKKMEVKNSVEAKEQKIKDNIVATIDQELEDFKKEITSSQQKLFDKYGYGYTKIKPFISEDFIKSLEEKNKKDKLAK